MNPTRDEVRQYAALSDAALMRHRLLMASGILPKPESRTSPKAAFDHLPDELKMRLSALTPEQKKKARNDLAQIRLALDASPGEQPMDDDEDGNAQRKLLELLQEVVPAEHLTSVLDAIRAATGVDCNRDLEHVEADEADADAPPANSPRGATDMPVPFKGMPQPGGKKFGMHAAMKRRNVDRRLSAADSYAERFPDAMRIGVR